MASTRNLNTKGDYLLEQRMNSGIIQQRLYDGFGVNSQPGFFRDGPNPSKMDSSHLSSNSTDIESMLRGIRATNLEGPSFQVAPLFKPMGEVSYFDKIPMVMPKTYYHSTLERPNYLS
jgi:hypothetical protein